MSTKKLLITAASIGLIAVPAIVVARNGGDDVNRQSDVHQEERKNDGQEDKREDRQDDDQNESRITTQNGIVKIENEAALPSGSITIGQAMATAKAIFPDKTIRKIEIETEDGAIVISVRFTDNSRIDVRAADGQITRQSDRNQNDNIQKDQDQNGDQDSHSSGGRGSSGQADDDDRSGSGR